ncbi:MAG: FKBP-type peptidyl-prolyl cis-trans isomerase [Longimicrobiales bacterium]
MKNRPMGAAAAVSLLSTVIVAACQGGLESAQNAPLEDDSQKASYAVGLQMGASLAPAADHIQLDALLRGIQDALAERDPAVPADSLQAVMGRFSQMVQEEQQAEMAASAQQNETEGASYLETNRAREGVTTTASGLQYEVMREAEGEKPGPDDQVRIHYKGTLIDGTQFDSSYDRNEPATFGVGGVIPGFSEGLQLMSVGSQYRFVIPGNLGYGPQGQGAMIPPNAVLIFEVELLEIVP